MVKLTKKQVEDIFVIFEKATPNPVSELFYTNNYTLLIAVMLSAQATDKGVNKATKPLFEIVQTPEQMISLGEQKLKSYIKSINYFNTKASNIIKTSKLLIDNFNGEVPNNQKSLESLNGVGIKTANVVRSTAFKVPTIAVDTHVFRVANRTGLANGKTVNEVESQLKAIIPPSYLYNAHHWLILHGRYVCKAQKPQCETCVIASFCLNKPKQSKIE